MFDIAVVGLGPAGRSLASACVARGARVLAVDPDPDGVWPPTYGLWADELGSLPEAAVRARMDHPEIRAHGSYDLARTYLVLDNAAAQRALPLDGAEIERGRLDDAGVAGLGSRARVVVDARGARPGGWRTDDSSPLQTAYGIVVDSSSAEPALGGAEALLMDFAPDWAEDPESPDRPPSFLYAIDLGGGRMLLEETCLAAAPGLPVDELRRRLHRRLARRGVADDVWLNPDDTEVVRIPMRGRGEAPVPGTLALGTAGRGGHVVSGYSVAHAFNSAGALADVIVAGGTPAVDPRRLADIVRDVALRALLRLDSPATIALFEAFGRMGQRHQRSFLRRDSSAPAVLGAMWAMFRSMPAEAKARLVGATFGPGGESRR